MISKASELNINIFVKYSFFLLHGKNEGFKNQIINENFKQETIISYDENEILNNVDQFLNQVLIKSLFDEKNIILIKRVSDKILEILKELTKKEIGDTIILNSEYLEKKSKLRNFFEKEKNCLSVPFYQDNEQVLFRLAFDFFKKKEINISSIDINLITSVCNGDRANLLNELKKIELYYASEKKINSKIIKKLINLKENHNVSELIDNCLAKNKKKILYILNENNYSNDDAMIIIKTLMNKSKKILELTLEYKNNNNIDKTISQAKPPIFWKDKAIIKEQIFKWKPESLKKLIYKLGELECIVKKNSNNSLYLTSDFLITHST